MLFPIDVIEDGSVIFESEEHNEKELSPIETTLDGIDISFSDSHPSNTLSLITVIDEGIVIFVIFRQSLKVFGNISVTFINKYSTISKWFPLAAKFKAIK